MCFFATLRDGVAETVGPVEPAAVAEGVEVVEVAEVVEEVAEVVEEVAEVVEEVAEVVEVVEVEDWTVDEKNWDVMAEASRTTFGLVSTHGQLRQE